jgi:hypothetical protein
MIVVVCSPLEWLGSVGEVVFAAGSLRKSSGC